MHRLIMAPPRHLFVDHINNDPLDNRRANLRLCTLQQNAMNAPGRGAVSGFKGVFLHRRSGRYYANITVDGRSHHLGSYVDPADAARAYDAAALAHFGEFAWINFKVAA